MHMNIKLKDAYKKIYQDRETQVPVNKQFTTELQHQLFAKSDKTTPLISQLISFMTKKTFIFSSLTAVFALVAAVTLWPSQQANAQDLLNKAEDSFIPTLTDGQVYHQVMTITSNTYVNLKKDIWFTNDDVRTETMDTSTGKPLETTLDLRNETNGDIQHYFYMPLLAEHPSQEAMLSTESWSNPDDAQQNRNNSHAELLNSLILIQQTGDDATVGVGNASAFDAGLEEKLSSGAEIVDEETVNGVAAYKIEMIPIDFEGTTMQRTVWIAKDSGRYMKERMVNTPTGQADQVLEISYSQGEVLNNGSYDINLFNLDSWLATYQLTLTPMSDEQPENSSEATEPDKENIQSAVCDQDGNCTAETQAGETTSTEK